jgi:hypothetical protein
MKFYKVKESILENTDLKFKSFISRLNEGYDKIVKIDDNMNVYNLSDCQCHVFRNSRKRS